MRKVLTIITVFCFVLSNLSFAIDSYPNKSYPGGINLATPSKFDDLQGIEGKDIGDIQLWFKACLSALKEQGVIITLSDLKRFKRLPDSPKLDNSIFSPKGTQFFIEEIEGIGSKRLKVMVRRKDAEYGLRTYYVEFSGAAEDDNIVVYPKDKSKERTERDAKAHTRYTKNNEAIIDAAIRERIKAGDFAEVEGRAKKLGWDKKYPNRKRPIPERYWSKKLLEGIKEKLDPFLAEFGTSVEKAFEGKNIVFLRTPVENFPVIEENGLKIPVGAHMSANAVYFFLTTQSFDGYTEYTKKPFAMAGVQHRRLVKYLIESSESPVIIEIGNSHGLSYEVMRDVTTSIKPGMQNIKEEQGWIRNDLYDAYWDYQTGIDIKEIETKYSELAKLKDEPVDLNLNLLDRDYAAAGEDIKEAIIEVLLKSRPFTLYELNRLIEIYEFPNLYIKAKALEQVDTREKTIYAVYKEVLDKLRGIFDNLDISIKYRGDGRIQINIIGGITTLKAAALQIESLESTSGGLGLDAVTIEFGQEVLPDAGIGANFLEVMSDEKVIEMFEAQFKAMAGENRIETIGAEVFARSVLLAKNHNPELQLQKLQELAELANKEKFFHEEEYQARRAIIRYYSHKEASLSSTETASMGMQLRQLQELAIEISKRKYQKYTLEALIRIDLLRADYEKEKQTARLIILRDKKLYPEESTRISITYALVEAGFEKAPKPKAGDIKELIETILEECSAEGIPVGAGAILYDRLKTGLLGYVSDIDVLLDVLRWIAFIAAEISKDLGQLEIDEVNKGAKIVTSIVLDRAKELAKKDIADKIALARSDETIKEIPTHPDERYTLLLISEFFANGELEAHRVKYGDRFNLLPISGKNPSQYLANIIGKAQGKEDKTIALVPDDLPDTVLNTLTGAGIRFIRVSRKALLEARDAEEPDKKQYRKQFQKDTYNIMINIRRMDDEISATSSIYQLVNFYIKSHFKLDENISVEDYIQAIITGNVALLIKGYLSYKPALPYDLPDYEKVAATQLSA